MKTKGIILIIVALTVGYFSVNITSYIWLERAVAFSLMCFLGGIFLLIIENKNPEKGSVPRYPNPPAPPKKCICNDIGKHTPGGRCEADHSIKPNNFLLSKIANFEFRFWLYDRRVDIEEYKDFNYLSATFQNALINDWFREVHNLHSYVERYDDGSFDYVITSDLFTEVFDYNDGPFKSFLDAQNKSIETMVSKIYDNKPIRPEFPKDRT
jgi:hypothetical protein